MCETSISKLRRGTNAYTCGLTLQPDCAVVLFFSMVHCSTVYLISKFQTSQFLRQSM